MSETPVLLSNARPLPSFCGGQFLYNFHNFYPILLTYSTVKNSLKILEKHQKHT